MRHVRLTKPQEAEIRALRRVNPRMPYRVIGSKFSVTPSAVCRVLTETKDAPPKVRMLLPEPEPKFESVIRPIPLERLMAGNGRVARCNHDA